MDESVKDGTKKNYQDKLSFKKYLVLITFIVVLCGHNLNPSMVFIKYETFQVKYVNETWYDMIYE